MKAWTTVIDCKDCEAFPKCVEGFESVCLAWPIFLEYVQKTWIKPHKEKFVRAWTISSCIWAILHQIGMLLYLMCIYMLMRVLLFELILCGVCRVEQAHVNLKQILQTNMGDLCTCWDAINILLVLQYNEIKASSKISLHVVSHTFNSSLYKCLVGMVRKYALMHIAEEFNKVKVIGFDKKKCGCVLRHTHGLPCACELARYSFGVIPLNEVHVMWTRLSFPNLSSSQSSSELSMRQEIDVILDRFDKVDIGGKITIKGKLREIAYPDMTSLCPQLEKVKTKGSQKSKQNRLENSTKRDPSYFEHVDKIHSIEDSCPTQKASRVKVKWHLVLPSKVLPILDQFHPICHPYIIDVIDVKAYEHCGYQSIAALLGMEEESWPNIINKMDPTGIYRVKSYHILN